jgi:CheY-like chemotaxis protein
LIDDEELGLFMLSAIREDAGRTVAIAGDGVQGMALQEAGTFDLVVTDMIMPHMEGTEMIAGIRARSGTLPIIAISGGARTENTDALQIAKQRGATAVLNKPFSEQELLDAVAVCLGMEEGGP